ncbi:MAG: PilZ domain-containing protein [Thermodesulfobacteriota bacterium]
MAPRDKRSFVREYFTFRVNYRLVPKEDYETVPKTGEQQESSYKKRLTSDAVNADKDDKGTVLDSSLVEFLLYMDEKLDYIIKMVSKYDAPEGVFYDGKGLDISGAGMKLEVEREMQPGQIIHANFILSKFPLVALDVFAEAVRVTSVKTAEKQSYKIGFRFLNLSERDREKVIACVFRKQRESIRERKDEGLNLDT